MVVKVGVACVPVAHPLPPVPRALDLGAVRQPRLRGGQQDGRHSRATPVPGAGHADRCEQGCHSISNRDAHVHALE